MCRERQAVARCKVERLMSKLGLCGAIRGKAVKTTQSDPAKPSLRDPVKRQFIAKRLNHLWVVDFTSV